MKFYKLFISRSNSIQKNRELAVLSLNLYQHSFGELVMVRYFNNPEQTEIDTVVTIGIKNGVGPDCHRIISLSGGNIITKIVRELPDISSLVHGEIYIYLDPDDENKPKYVYEVNGEKIVEEITGGPYKYEVVEDGYRWYFVDGVLKREDDFYSKQEILDLIDNLNNDILEEIKKIKEELNKHNDWLIELDKEVFPISIKLTNKTGSLFLTGTTQNIRLSIEVIRKNKDITKDCTFRLNGESITLEEDNSYTAENITSTTTFNLEATYTELDLIKTASTTVNFGYNYYYGLVPKDGWESTEDNIKQLSNKLSTKSNQSLRFNLDLEHRSVFCCPKIYGKITSIKDQSNLEYIKDYEDPIEVTVDSVEYYVYKKITLVIYNNFLQIFNY